MITTKTITEQRLILTTSLEYEFHLKKNLGQKLGCNIPTPLNFSSSTMN